MKRIMLIALIAANLVAMAQVKKNVYKLRIFKTDKTKQLGYLRAVGDSAIVITSKHNVQSPADTINYSQIHIIKIRKRNAIGKGVAIGTAGGVALGALIGYSSYEEPQCSSFCFDFGPGFSALGGALVGGACGSVVGLLVGSISKEVKISANYEAFSNARSELSRFVVKP